MTTHILFRSLATTGLVMLCAVALSVGVSAQGKAPRKSATAKTSVRREAPAQQTAAKNPPVKGATPGDATVLPPVSPIPEAVLKGSAAEGYAYTSNGRRDPFLSLINRAFENRPVMKKPDGLRGLTVDEIVLRGIMQTPGGAIAIVQGPDGKPYRVRAGDQLYDAVIKAITADSLVLLQEVNDPLSLQKQRERRKMLRVVEEVK